MSVAGEYPTIKKVAEITARTAGLAEKHKGVVRDYYTPRRIHIPWRVWHMVVGAASHAAWVQLHEEGVERVRGRFPFETIKARRAELLKAVSREITTALVDTGKLPAIPVVKAVPKLVTIEIPAAPTVTK